MREEKKTEKKSEYRIISRLDWEYGICYIVQRHKTFLGIGYWENLGKSGIKGRYTMYRYKEMAEQLIEQYKRGEIEEKETGIEGYY